MCRKAQNDTRSRVQPGILVRSHNWRSTELSQAVPCPIKRLLCHLRPQKRSPTTARAGQTFLTFLFYRKKSYFCYHWYKRRDEVTFGKKSLPNPGLSKTRQMWLVKVPLKSAALIWLARATTLSMPLKMRLLKCAARATISSWPTMIQVEVIQMVPGTA